MALIKCTKCGHIISDKATKCPKCGCPTTKGTESHIPQEKPQVQPVYYEEEEGGRPRKWLYGIMVEKKGNAFLRVNTSPYFCSTKLQQRNTYII